MGSVIMKICNIWDNFGIIMKLSARLKRLISKMKYPTK